MPKRRANGSGTVSEVRPGVWQLKVSKDGKRRSRTVHGTEDEARAALAEFAAQLGSTVDGAEEWTLGAFARAVWLPTLERRGRARATVMGYEKNLRCHIEPAFGDLPLAEVDERKVRRWVWTMEPGVSEGAWRALRACLRFAYDEGYLADKPLDRRVERPKQPKRVKALWDARQAAEGLERIRGWMYEPIALVMLGAGLRREEAAALNAGDVSMAESGCALVAVTKAYTTQDGMKPTKTHQERVAVVPPPMSGRLMGLLPESGPLCKGRLGARPDPNALTKAWRALWEQGKMGALPYITLNQLRHVHETLMVSAAMASKLHGHSSAVEYDHYLGVAAGAAEKASLVISEALLSARVNEG